MGRAVTSAPATDRAPVSRGTENSSRPASSGTTTPIRPRPRSTRWAAARTPTSCWSMTSACAPGTPTGPIVITARAPARLRVATLRAERVISPREITATGRSSAQARTASSPLSPRLPYCTTV